MRTGLHLNVNRICRALLVVWWLFTAGSTAALSAGIAVSNNTGQHRYDRALKASAVIFQQATGVQVGVVLQAHLPPGKTIEVLASELFTRMGLGRTTGGDAILLLWSQAEQQFKIEVSYSLEGVFPDLLCHQLEQAARSYLLAATPYAQRDFLTELLVTLRIHYLDWRSTGRVPPATAMQVQRANLLTSNLSGGAGVTRRDYREALRRASALAVALTADQAARFAAAPTARETLLRYMASLSEGVGSPLLGLLSEGSRYYRMERPHGGEYARRIAAYYQNAMPFTLWERGSLAVALFRPGYAVLPVLLQRDLQGYWHVDEVKGPAYFQLAEQGGSAQFKYADFSHARAWRETPGAQPVHPLFAGRALSPPKDSPEPLSSRLAKLQARAGSATAKVEDILALAQLLHFDLYWLEAAAPLYESALALQPQRDTLRWTLVDVYTNTSDVDALERHLRALLSRNPHDAFTAYYLGWFEKTYPR